MYNFFTIFGFFFICICSIIMNYIYDLFPINRLTMLLKPTFQSTWAEISATTLPIILWPFIELPVFGSNSNFLLAVVCNLFVSWSVLYVIRYGAKLFKKENNIIRISSIIIATCFGQLASYLILVSGEFAKTNILVSLIGLLFIFLLYLIIGLFPPKTMFFQGK